MNRCFECHKEIKTKEIQFNVIKSALDGCNVIHNEVTYCSDCFENIAGNQLLDKWFSEKAIVDKHLEERLCNLAAIYNDLNNKNFTAENIINKLEKVKIPVGIPDGCITIKNENGEWVVYEDLICSNMNKDFFLSRAYNSIKRILNYKLW